MTNMQKTELAFMFGRPDFSDVEISTIDGRFMLFLSSDQFNKKKQELV